MRKYDRFTSERLQNKAPSSAKLVFLLVRIRRVRRLNPHRQGFYGFEEFTGREDIHILKG
jgi:hypothetical protein